ncbi:MAG: KAP family NTPase [Actinobacteria bacterium]|nr:KAP family NTPase [Actinomycetota bacterium]
MPEKKSWLVDDSLDLSESDAFDVTGLVDRMADLVELGDPPFTISLSGSWGVGKSTIAEALRRKLETRKIPGVLVDAWTEDIGHLRRTLAIWVGAKLSVDTENRESVAKKLDDAIQLTENKTLPPKLNLASGGLFKNITDWLKSSAVLLAIDIVLIALVVCSAIWFPAYAALLGALLSASLIFTIFQSGLFLHIVTTSQSRAPASESVETANVFRQLVTTKDKHAPDKVLVVVDNLDRLEGSDALGALAQIRALVEIPGSRAIFLIPIDRAALARHIESNVEPEVSADAGQLSDVSREIAAADYLEKFFNLDLQLTRPDVLDLRQWALREGRRILSEDDEVDLTTAVQVVCSAANGSPRSVKRILNGVAARRRLLYPTAVPQISLTQLAFIEGLTAQFPELVSWLAPDGRRFVRLREQVKKGRAVSEQVHGLTETRKNRLRDYLLANSEIRITAPMTRLAMSLREDTAWKGVSDPTSLQQALDTGQSDAFSVALAETDNAEVENAIAGSVSYIERSVPAFPRDAINGLLAVGETIGDHAGPARRLHPLAVQAFIECDDVNRRRVTRSLAIFLFAGGYRHSDLRRLASDFVKTLKEADPKANVSQGLVWATKLSDPHLTEQLRSTVRESLKGLDDSLLSPLFEEPGGLWAAEGPVANKYVERLSAWEASSPDYSSLLTAIGRLQVLLEAGKHDPATLQPVADRTASQTRGLPDDADGFRLVDQLTKLLWAVPACSEVDQLAKLLVSLPGTVDPPARLASALRLSVSEEIKPAVVNPVTAWLQSAGESEARKLVIDEKSTLESFGVDPVPTLIGRWAASQGENWARLAADFDNGRNHGLLAGALSGSPDNQYAKLSKEAAAIIASRGDKEAGDSLVGEMVRHLPRVSAGSLAEFGETLASLQGVNVDISPFIEALRTRIVGQESSLGDMANSIRELHEGGITEMRSLGVPLALRGSAAGGIQLEEVEWLVHATNGSNEARRVAVRVIESAPIQHVCRMSEGIRRGLRSHWEVNLALVRRANATSTEAETVSLLNATHGWNRPSGAELREYRDLLTAIANRWTSAEMTELVSSLQ